MSDKYRNWDGKMRPSNNQYRDNFDKIKILPRDENGNIIKETEIPKVDETSVEQDNKTSIVAEGFEYDACIDYNALEARSLKDIITQCEDLLSDRTYILKVIKKYVSKHNDPQSKCPELYSILKKYKMVKDI
jgi:hypothetical protein